MFSLMMQSATTTECKEKEKQVAVVPSFHFRKRQLKQLWAKSEVDSSGDEARSIICALHTASQT